MGVNLVWVCHDHKRFHYSMRSEEGIDFQALVRTRNEAGCPSECFKRGRIRVYLDSNFDTTDFNEWWPVWEERPAELHKMKPAPPQYEVRDRYDVAWYPDGKDEEG